MSSPWWVGFLLGMKYYPVMRGLFHKPLIIRMPTNQPGEWHVIRVLNVDQMVRLLCFGGMLVCQVLRCLVLAGRLATMTGEEHEPE